jgi:hypothetical protein
MSIATRDDNGNAVEIFRAGTAQVLTVTNSSVQSAAFGTNTTHVLVSCSLGHCHIAFGASPTATVTTSTMIVPNAPFYFSVKAGEKVAVIKDSTVTSSTFSITELV